MKVKVGNIQYGKRTHMIMSDINGNPSMFYVSKKYTRMAGSKKINMSFSKFIIDLKLHQHGRMRCAENVMYATDNENVYFLIKKLDIVQIVKRVTSQFASDAKPADEQKNIGSPSIITIFNLQVFMRAVEKFQAYDWGTLFKQSKLLYTSSFVRELEYQYDNKNSFLTKLPDRNLIGYIIRFLVR